MMVSVVSEHTKKPLRFFSKDLIKLKAKRTANTDTRWDFIVWLGVIWMNKLKSPSMAHKSVRSIAYGMYQCTYTGIVTGCDLMWKFRELCAKYFPGDK